MTIDSSPDLAAVRPHHRAAPARAGVVRLAAAHAILDEGLVAHVGLSTDDGPVVIPMLYGRDGDRLLLHGSTASRLLRGGAKGTQLCVTVTLVDGLVLARSAFHHSMNYRSVVVFGGRHPSATPPSAGPPSTGWSTTSCPAAGPTPARPATARPAERWCWRCRSTSARSRCAPADPSTRTRTWTCRCGPAWCPLATVAGSAGGGRRPARRRAGAGLRDPLPAALESKGDGPPTAPRQPAGGPSRPPACHPGDRGTPSPAIGRRWRDQVLATSQVRPADARLDLGAQLGLVPGVEEVGVARSTPGRRPATGRGRRR